MVARPSTSRSRPFTAAIHELAARPDAAVLLDMEGTILFANEAWERFSALAGESSTGTLVGSRLVDAVRGDEPREVLRRLLARAAVGPLAHPISVTSECNGPDLARLMTTQISPIVAGTELIGLTFVQRVVRELPVSEVYQVVEGAAEDYRGDGGALEQCSCCRRTRRPSDPSEWDFVPALVAAPPDDAQFGYCPLCRALHHPLGSSASEEEEAGQG
jgi:hypothetical protein